MPKKSASSKTKKKQKSLLQQQSFVMTAAIFITALLVGSVFYIGQRVQNPESVTGTPADASMAREITCSDNIDVAFSGDIRTSNRWDFYGDTKGIRNMDGKLYITASSSINYSNANLVFAKAQFNRSIRGNFVAQTTIDENSYTRGYQGFGVMEAFLDDGTTLTVRARRVDSGWTIISRHQVIEGKILADKVVTIPNSQNPLKMRFVKKDGRMYVFAKPINTPGTSMTEVIQVSNSTLAKPQIALATHVMRDTYKDNVTGTTSFRNFKVYCTSQLKDVLQSDSI